MTETFCVLPFLHLKAGIDGKVSPCCRFPMVSDEFDFTSFDVSSRTLEDMFYSQEYQELRRKMRCGEKVSGCQQCYKDEAAGARSLRQTQNIKYEALQSAIFEKPEIRFLEVAVGNICNLKCIMCNAAFSYKWINDERSLEKDNFVSYRPNLKTTVLVDNVLKFDPATLADLRDIKVVGGEPLLQNKMIDFLERLEELGLAKQVAIEIYTNTTHWPSERALKALGAFREVQLLFSIDGVGEQVEYIRHPTKWADVERNVQKWLKIPERFPSIYLSCNYTVNLLNAWYYDRIADWWHATTAGTPYEKHLETTFVNNPDYISMSLLPESIKQAIREKMTAYQQKHSDRLYVKYNTKRLLSRLNLKPETSISQFYRYVESLDRVRKTNWKTIFPELADMLENNCEVSSFTEPQL